VHVSGPGGEQQVTADNYGRYAFPSLKAGKYTVRVTAPGFTTETKNEVDISGPIELNPQLAILAETQVVNVEDDTTTVTTDPNSNGTSVVLKEKELQALSDDPDELAQELQAMAGPGSGPNGGQVYIDGFTGGNLPPKSSIREVRINSNPFSSEYDRPGFGRIEILTKPGTDTFRGQVFGQFNNEMFNTRSPLLQQSSLPPYKQIFYGANVTGPIKKEKASFGFNLEGRTVDENAFILATTLDSNFNPVTVNQGIVTPQMRINISPRLDYTISPRNTLAVRYQHSSNEFDKQGIGGFNLVSRAYDTTFTENTVQVTETAVLNTSAVTETRFQYMRNDRTTNGDNTVPSLSVQGAFTGGGPQIGNSGNLTNHWEVTSSTTYTKGTQVWRFGARLRQSLNDDTSVNNFGGAYTFLGGIGPVLDANNQPIAGTSTDLTALERYRRTLLFQQQGLSAAAIRALGGGASYFSLSAGTPTTDVNQFDIGLFINNDWRARPNLTLSYGVRYETQSNIHDFADWSPRVAIAWGVGGSASKPAGTVVRAGFGIFYDRISDNVTLQAERFNGSTQQSYFLINPNTFPVIPTPDQLAASQQPQVLRPVYDGIRAPRTYQVSAGVDRQVNKYIRFSAQYMETRGVSQQMSRNINAPIFGAYPFGDPLLRVLTESVGVSRTHQIVFSPSVNYKRLQMFGFYGISYGRDNITGSPADPYNLRAEWGPSGFSDVRQRATIGSNVTLPWNISLSPFLTASTGVPYNITTGRDTNGDGVSAERPALLGGVAAADCHTGNLLYAAEFGCFNLLPAPGTKTISRNYARGPGMIVLNARIARTWSFGARGERSANGGGGFGGGRGPGGDGGGRGPGGPGGFGGGGPRMMGPPPGGGGRGPGGPMFMGGPGGGGGKYNLTVSINAQNVLNHPNFSAPVGDLSSPFFGQSLGLNGGFGGGSTYNRKIDFQLRFAF
jgi:hypothetical protein